MARARLRLQLIGLVLAATAVATQAPPVQWSAVAPGVEHAQFTREAGGGQWNINALRLDLSRARLDVVRARDAAVGLETTSAIAARTNAIAAINGGYFRMTGDFAGDSTGTLQIDGRIWSEPDRGRAAVGIMRSNGAARLIFGHVVWRATLTAGDETHPVDGVNRARGPNDLVVFTPDFGPAALTDARGIEAVVRDGRVTDIHDDSGATAIPSGGFLVSARGAARDWVRKHLAKGTRVTMTARLMPADSGDVTPWEKAEDILGAGPRLVTGGRVDVTDKREQMIPNFATDLHPRSAIAALEDGRALLVVVDGRHPPERVGIALDDLARLLIELGAREAINLDGGGSTTMVVRGQIVNHPSDVTGERPVSDALVVRAPGPDPR